MAAPSRLNGLVYYAVLTVAAGIDIATFYQVLALVMRNVPDEIVWLGVVGFTVTALALAHTIGVRIRDRVDNGGRALGSSSAWMLFIVWLFVGITAFVVRLTAAPPQLSGGTTIIEEGQPVTFGLSPTDDPLLAALLFLALYFATGAVAGVAGYLRHNTAAKQYAATLKARSEVAKVAAVSAADLALARQTLYALQEERRRREDGWVKAQEEWAAIARRLKQEARLRLASHAQNPSVTDAYFEPPPYLRHQGTDATVVLPPTAPPGYVPPPSSGPQPGYVLPPGYTAPGYTAPGYGAPSGYGGPAPYPAPAQTPGPTVPAVAEQPGWRSPGAHRPPVDNGGTDHREARR
jgi:hypothetical protein